MNRKIMTIGQRKIKAQNNLIQQKNQDYSYDYLNQDYSCMSFLIDDDVQDMKRILDDNLNVNDDETNENKKQCIQKPIYDVYRQKMDIKFESEQPDTIEKFQENLLEYDTTDISVYDDDFKSCDQQDIDDLYYEQHYQTKKSYNLTSF